MRASRLAAIAMAIVAAGCSGSDGSQGPQGPQGAQGDPGTPGTPGAPGADLTATAKPESCVLCHASSGEQHQAIYNQSKDASNLTANFVSVRTVAGVTTVRFDVTYNGHAATQAEFASFSQKSVGAVNWDGAQFANSCVTSFAAPYYVADGQFAATATATTYNIESTNGIVFGYVAANPLPTEITMYSDVANFGSVIGTVPYTSKANVAGCERCHGAPYGKHGYIRPSAEGTPAFSDCKICHYDTRNGGHQDWSRLVNEPRSFATALISAAQKTTYAYKANLMNDVHMSHAMEFAYPQSMANCITCHDAANLTGAAGTVNAISNFRPDVCKSCHAWTDAGTDRDAKRAPPLEPILNSTVTGADVYHAGLSILNGAAANACTGCHGTMPAAPTFAQLHSGYDAKIFNASGVRYKDIFAVTVDSAVLTGTTLAVHFTATKTGTDPIALSSIAPTVLIGLYGYDTKDFIVDAHGKDAAGQRLLEYTFGTTHPRFKNAVYTAAGAGSVDVNLSDWATMLNTVVTRIEVGVMPALKNAAGTIVALNAPSKTFAVADGAVITTTPVIADAVGCNKCHDALGTTFHDGDRGGNVAICRFCHSTRQGGGHLEMQSRSIDSYVHAIHRFQPFDIKNYDFTDAVSAMRYSHHTESTYPLFTINACESCHGSGTVKRYNVPANDKSLPGTLSAAAVMQYRGGWNPGNSSTRNGPLVAPSVTPVATNIRGVPSYVTGPGSRACGSCHRATMINENDGARLAAFNEHTEAMGTLLPASTGVLDAAITKLFGLFK